MASPLPIPYGMGGVIPNAMGGNPVLPNNFAGLLGQLPTAIPTAGSPVPYGFGNVLPKALGGTPNLNFDFTGFHPNGSLVEQASALPRSLAEVPVSIRPGVRGAAGAFDQGLLSQLGTGAEGLGAEVAGAAGSGGFLSRIASRLPMAEGVGLKGFAKGAIGPIIASVALNKAAGMAGGNESFLGRALKGAGTGTLGFALGPEVGIPSTILGAVLGGVGGKPKDGTPVWLKDEVLNRAGFNDQDKAQIQMTYDILKETQGKDKANAAIGQLIMQDITQRQQQKQEDESSQRRMLATQALTAQFFQPFTKQMMDSAQQRYQVSESLAKDLPPEYRSIMRAQNAASLDNANRVATAYASQAQLIPQLATIDYQNGLAQQLAQQQAATVIQGMGIGGGGSQGGSLSNLAAQLQLQPQG